MPRTWQLQAAKNKLSQVVDEAQHSGPQIITRRGVKTAVVLSFEEYCRLIASREKLSTFFRQSPLAEVELDLERDKSPVRPGFQP
jgi:prevent-host-death family protein